ncbi:MAG TPA: acetamidase/formamidase family protein [Gaiellaceae bacterium]|nr:acetamidase/formamidase family protein [Gaiellaceae bacterium]
MTEHALTAAQIHHNWDKNRPAAIRIQSGDIVHFVLPITGEGQVAEDSRVEDVNWNFDTIYNLAGPVFVEGAEPGDTLEVQILDLKPGAWGWTTIIPELGLLPDDFPDPFLKIFDLRSRNRATLASGVSVPIQPFLGTMGVTTDDDGELSPFPPHKGGGNMDNRHLVPGSTLWLPVWCDGALFSCGDAHAAQGDGEVCVSAIECAMDATLRLNLLKESSPTPAYETPTIVFDPGPYHGTMGIDSDLMEGARTAVRSMIQWLENEHGLGHEDAYVLCSIAGNLHIHEVVDAGTWNVGFTLPLSVFDASGAASLT